eukprot:GFUD01028477.1.p1 GENE.GFUD01028477.1~~GFUD01028477.1.p1  ORF type:complete len:378 (+),score=112.53 GFUD01028477.1:61-1194(+)
MPARASRKLSGVGGLRREEDNKERNARGKVEREEEKVKRISAVEKIRKVKEVLRKQVTCKEDSDPSTSKQKSQKSAVLNGSPASPRTGQLYIGYHASSAGGVHHAITHTVSVGARCLALFIRPQRTWAAPPLAPSVASMFRTLSNTHSIQKHMILPHGSYLVNLGSPDKEQRDKSVEMLVEELERCRDLGIIMFNIHPGSSCGKISRDECIRNIADGVNSAHVRTVGSGVKVVLENMSCQGHTIGGDLREIKQIIDLVVDKSRVGVCLDTCHAMAAGYDLSTQAGFDRLLEEFGREVGWQWLVGMHLNDSMGPAGCHRDRHANIGEGTIGMEGFRRIVNCQHFTDIPIILETPLDEKIGIEKYKMEIKMLLEMVQRK